MALRFRLYLVPYLVIGYDILIKAAKGIRNRQVFDENFLMAIATVGAIALALYEGSGDYTEAVAVMLFYQVGEWFQSYAVGKSRRNISELMDIRPDYANVERDGALVQVDPDEVEIGHASSSCSRARRCPSTASSLEGAPTLNTAALTGESLPREVARGRRDPLRLHQHERPARRSARRRNSASPPSPRSWTWWRTPPRASRSPRTSSPSSRASTRPRSASPRWRWRCCRRWCGCSSCGLPAGVGDLDLPRADVPGHLLPVRAGHQHPAVASLRASAGRATAGVLVKGSNYLETLSKTRDRGL